MQPPSRRAHGRSRDQPTPQREEGHPAMVNNEHDDTSDTDEWMHGSLVNVALTPNEWAHVVAALGLAPVADWQRIAQLITRAVMETTK
jgi:hypothetical protein